MKIPIKKVKSPSIELLPMYDVHYGSKECAEDILIKAVDYIKRHSTCYTFGGGDLIECNVYGKLNNVHSQKVQVTEQIEHMVNILKPIKNKILFMISGNHEQRIENATGLNIVKIMAEMLDVPFLGWEAHFLLKLKNHLIRCYAHHGTGASVTSGAKLNAVEKLHFRSPFAHMIFSGHLHFQVKSEKEIRFIDKNGKFRVFNQHFISCGALHKSDGYATMKAYAPLPTHMTRVKIRISENGLPTADIRKFE